MRIVNFNASLHPELDGVTRVLGKLVEGAHARGHGVMCIGADRPHRTYPNIPTISVPSFAVPGRSEYHIALPGYGSFARQLREWKPDVMHIHSPCPLGFAAARFGLDHGIPVVATYHTHFPTYLQYYNATRWDAYVWRRLRRLYNPLDTTFVPALSVQRAIRDMGVRHTEYLPNAVDTSAFSPAYRSAAWRASVGAESLPVVLFTSRIVWEKNLRVLAATYNILRQRRNDFVMVVVGDGPARKKFEPMMPGAKFLGWLDGVPLSTSYASSDIFVFPSISETFGLVTVEAMASGLAAAAARAGGAADIIRHERSGLLAEPDDPHALAASVERLLDNPELRAMLIRNGMQRVTEFGWEPMYNHLFSRYEEIIAEKQHASDTARSLAV